MPSEFDFTLLKIASTWALRRVRELVDAGKLEEAEEFARKTREAGALKTTAAGSQVKILGRGAEGVGSLVTGVDRGAVTAGTPELMVRKAYDPSSPIVSRGVVGEKFNLLRRIRSDRFPSGSEYSTLYSTKLGKGPGGTLYQHMEYAPMSFQEAFAGRKLQGSVYKGLSGEGPGNLRRILSDLHRGNIRAAVDPRTGKVVPKVIDFVAHSPEDFQRVSDILRSGSTPGLPHRAAVPPAARPFLDLYGRNRALASGAGIQFLGEGKLPAKAMGKHIHEASIPRTLRGLGPSGATSSLRSIPAPPSPPAETSPTVLRMLGEARGEIPITPTVVSTALSRGAETTLPGGVGVIRESPGLLQRFLGHLKPRNLLQKLIRR